MENHSFNQTWREGFWQELNDDTQPWDMIVVGGGITGAGIFREAVRLGLRVLLLEQKDYSWGTSSRSSKLVHGGLRYLKDGHVFLTRDSIVERQRLMRECPGLVEHLNFLISLYEGQKPGRWTFQAGLLIYDLLASRLQHQHLDKQDFLLSAPHLKEEGLQGGLRYGDARTDDSRLVLRLIFEGMRDGGRALNYVRAEKPEPRVDGITAVTVRDRRTDRVCRLQARVVVNATGAWADRLRNGEKRLRPLRGSHLVFHAWRVPAPQAMTILHPDDQRPLFLLPWEGATILGTTDVDHSGNLDTEAAVTAEEVRYMMKVLEVNFPKLNLTIDDIVASWSGVRPVISSGAADPSKESRDHAVWDDDGVMTITGGKLTTFRKMAFDLLHKAKHYLPPIQIDKTPPVMVPPEVPWDRLPPLSQAVRRRLGGRYGLCTEALVRAAEDGELDLVSGTETLWAELRWAARDEQVVHLDDLLLRRTRLGLLLEQGGAAHEARFAAICQAELGWSEARWRDEWRRYRDIWTKYYSIPDALRATEPTAAKAKASVTEQEVSFHASR
ncbi:glycerol-3-phosphate dehydrogenase/oxidase [Acanthopleuribacter pedis]|uniref:Glycerol-3-phosphate dehydrogenase/oxidase n=1 Tax=Acanthopleuribacter pedis TaxID=442870 RepID=A0A8J7QD14_9BACT|nr:glycerol-3-phosphate dehydrogenase/oxidase [Acanthopleuribacter pedis]MBO1321879.1 glycerol-3-phosphate dehydrogenase/oxidase [Acanthopleuribacter pedis]